jgi:hypothetical protein
MVKKSSGPRVIKEIAPKIKEVSSGSEEEESDLEQEVREEEEIHREEFSSSSGISVPSLPAGEIEEIEREPVNTRINRREQEGFSQSISYDTTRPTGEQIARSYISETSRAQAAPILRQDLSLVQRRDHMFENPEMAKIRGEQMDREYGEPLDMTKQDKPRRRYPWEV